jgi:hypothetical protein
VENLEDMPWRKDVKHSSQESPTPVDSKGAHKPVHRESGEEMEQRKQDADHDPRVFMKKQQTCRQEKEKGRVELQEGRTAGPVVRPEGYFSLLKSPVDHPGVDEVGRPVPHRVQTITRNPVELD